MRAVVHRGEKVVSASSAASVKLVADVTAINAPFDELLALLKEAGSELPKVLNTRLRNLPKQLGRDILAQNDVPASTARELVVRLRFRRGGRVERLIAALRALVANRD